MFKKISVAFLSLAILAGGAYSADAQQASSSAPSSASDNNPNGDGGKSSSNDNRGGRQTATSTKGFGGAGETFDRKRVPGCAEINQCPPRTKKKKIRPFVLKLTQNENDCECKRVAMSVNGRTQIVLDCYKTKLFNGAKRTYVCNRPE